MKLTTKNYLGLVVSILMMLFPATELSAQFEQEQDPFADDMFEIDQPVMRRNVRRGQWVPSTYQDQAALIEKRVKASIKRKLDYRFETVGTLASGDYAPFWLVSNRQGLSSLQNKSGYIRVSALGGMLLPNKFGVDYGMDMSINTGFQSSYYIQQVYVDLKYSWLTLSMGSKERWGEMKNPYLSSGGLTWSGNALPMPQMRIEVPEFTRLNILGGWFSLKGHIGYGRYTDSKYREETAMKISKENPSYANKILHHSKSAFLKVGDVDRFPLEFIWGLEMYSQFGGEMYNTATAGEFHEYKKYPSGIGAYWDALLPFNPTGKQDHDNGNSLGSWHLSFDLTFDKWKYRAYYEHFYEDHSSMLGIEYKSNAQGEKDFVFYGYKRNWFDGQFGIEINAPDGLPFKNIVLEFMKTKDQCGSLCVNTDAVAERVDGAENYYNHTVYKSYTHWGYAIGNPVLVSPIYNKDNSMLFKSNRAIMFHLGVDGRISPKIDYKFLATNTRHWGTYINPLNKVANITSLMLECSYWTGDAYSWKFSVAGAMDIQKGGTLMGASNNKGIMLTVSKVWDIL